MHLHDTILYKYLLLGLLCLLLPSHASAIVSSYNTNDETKAHYLLNFLKFVHWPENSNSSTKRLCTFGDTNLGKTLATIQFKNSRNLPISIENDIDLNEIDSCHILYITPSEDLALKAVLDKVNAKAILTVSDIEHFSEKGGMVGFTELNGYTRLIINQPSIHASGLSVQNGLLQIALKVIR